MNPLEPQKKGLNMNIIPECIRNVLRPKDTQIIDTKSSSHKHFAVHIKYTEEERAKRYQLLCFQQARQKIQKGQWVSMAIKKIKINK